MRVVRTVLVAAILAAMQTAWASAGEAVDLLLVLAADVSRSVDSVKFQLQRDGYVAAFSNPRVLEAIRSGRNGRIAVCLVEWSGMLSQKVVIDWTLIKDAGSGRQFGDRLIEAQRSFAERTAIGAGIDFAAAQFARAPYESTRRTIDVSGDGTNNSGPDVKLSRDAAVTQNITINGLVILSERPLPWNPDHTHPPGGLANYYRENVIGGPGAFVMTAERFRSFGESLINKLVAEIAEAGTTRHAAAAPAR